MAGPSGDCTVASYIILVLYEMNAYKYQSLLLLYWITHLIMLFNFSVKIMNAPVKMFNE